MVEYPTKDCTLTAVYTAYEDRFFNVTFDLAGGAFEDGYVAPTTINPVTPLPTPVKEGYDFLGWYDANGNKVESVMEDVSLTAKWELTQYTVSLDANGGKLATSSIETFAAEFMADFNKAAEAEIEMSNFQKSTSSAIKKAWSNEEFYNKYQWVLEYAVKVLESAGANAENNLGMNKANLYVAECYADGAATLKRFQPVSKGRAHSIKKRTSHITIILDEKKA